MKEIYLVLTHTGTMLSRIIKTYTGDEFSHISVGSVLCGGVSIGKATFVVANATVIQEKKIGNNCVLGAGTTIHKDVKDGYMVWNKDQVKSLRIS